MQRLPKTTLVLALTCVAATHFAATPATAQTRIATALQWRSIGPAIAGGRISDVEIVPGTQSHIYLGAASGGVWVSVNHGTTWTPLGKVVLLRWTVRGQS